MISKVLLASWTAMMVLMVACACGNSSTPSLATPEISPQAIPSATPKVSTQVIPSATPGVLTQATPSATPSFATPEVSTRVNPSATPEVSAQATPSAAPSLVTPPETGDTKQLSGDVFFPLGFMGVPEEGRFPQIAAGGFNVVHEFRSIQEIDAAEEYLNQAEAAGLEVIQNMPLCRAYASPHPICQEHNIDIWGEGEWAEFISTLATHENLVAWYLPDEIDDYLAAANLYKWVKTYDPHQRPVYGNPGTYQQSAIDLFPAFTDFVWIAAYTDYKEYPRAVVTYAMDLAANACRGTGTRWGAILQFFDSADLGESGGHPTAHEIRCDSYQAVIGGATGLWYYSYARGQDLAELLAGIERVNDEIRGAGGLEEVILSPETPQTITKVVVSGPTWFESRDVVYDSIQTLQKEYQGTYLFAVNIVTDNVVVEFGNLTAEAVAVEVLFEGRTIPVSDNSFRDSFGEADVHIYRVLTGG
jgi:hypothetical protein